VVRALIPVTARGQVRQRLQLRGPITLACLRWRASARGHPDHRHMAGRRAGRARCGNRRDCLAGNAGSGQWCQGQTHRGSGCPCARYVRGRGTTDHGLAWASGFGAGIARLAEQSAAELLVIGPPAPLTASDRSALRDDDHRQRSKRSVICPLRRQVAAITGNPGRDGNDHPAERIGCP